MGKINNIKELPLKIKRKRKKIKHLEHSIMHYLPPEADWEKQESEFLELFILIIEELVVVRKIRKKASIFIPYMKKKGSSIQSKINNGSHLLDDFKYGLLTKLILNVHE